MLLVGFALGLAFWLLLARGLRHATLEELEARTPEDVEPPAGADGPHD
jgi:hypothetical protein